VRPLSADRYQVTFTASAAVCEKLELAKDLLRHAVPSGDPAQVVERGLDVLIAELVKQKYAVTSRYGPGKRYGGAEVVKEAPAAYACHRGHVFVPERKSIPAAARILASKQQARLDQS
jgi:hypothetical protein